MSLASLPPRDRIIRSLFNDKDESGAALESYITHVKIFEDVQYPSEPPPSPTPQENLKERYILLSVKKNGRVRMHKSRANDNGTFQIGKTWNLEDLQKVQDTDKRGLIINLLKPYYWTMETPKDKYMFVSALTKVYKKYTGGRMFEMLNFESQHVPSERQAPTTVSQRQERSVSAQNPASRVPPQPTSPLKSQRAVSDIHEKLPRESPRQAPPAISQSTKNANLPSYFPTSTPGAPSRVTSSQYGGPDRLSTATNPMRSPEPVRSQQRSISGTVDDRSRRGAVPFASPPLNSTRTMPNPNGDFARAMDASTATANKTTVIDTRPFRPTADNLGSPMSLNDFKPPQSPNMDRPPEKSLRRQALESPATEMAPALPRHFDIPPQSSMSPPPPAKSPARRPSNIRVNTNGSSRGAHDRLHGVVSPMDSPSGSIPDVPSLPSKSGARSADINKTSERAGLPWATPSEKRVSEDYFSNAPLSTAKSPVTAEPAHVNGPSVAADTPLSPLVSNALVLNADTSDQIIDNEASTSEDVPDDESVYIDEAIRDFRWTSQHGATLLASRLEDELSVLEAANVHTMVENDSRVEELMAKLDQGIAQCDDMVNILTIYDFELATISEHVKHIEGQSQGLQVQTANQQALVNEISRVLQSITISDSDLDVLKGRGGNLESLDGITNIESSLSNLYRALKSLRDEKSSGTDQSMSALQPKKKEYMNESSSFLARLSQYLQIKFQAALLTKEEESVSRLEPSRVMKGHEDGFMALAPYTALMLYAREIEPSYHSDYMRAYASAAKSSWHGAISDFIGQWRSRARKASSEENDQIFTAARDQQSIGPTRNATLKRSNTIAKQIKSVTTTKGEKESLDARPPASDVFRTILDNLALLFANEQNFLVSFFHLSSFNNYEFPDYVDLEVKSRLTIDSLDDHRPTEPSRTFAKEKYILMESIFGWLNGDLATLVDYLANTDSIQVVGIIKSIEVVTAEWANSDQEFMLKTLQRLRDRLMGLLNRFIDAQVKAIKDIKVTSKKRKGVIAVFEIFPDFVERVEVQLQSTESEQVRTNQLEIRETVNEAYEQMSKAMFQSVKTLASSTTVTTHGLADPEDKETLNYHILMVQNMHQYIEALQSRNNLILEDFQFSAQKQYAEHLLSYTRQIILRPIGRLVEFADAFEKSQNQKENTMSKASFSPTALRRILADHDDRDMKKGISAMRKRVDKHFSDDEGVGGQNLLGTVWKATQQEYLSVVDKVSALMQAHYPDVRAEWSRQNLTAAFAKRDV